MTAGYLLALLLAEAAKCTAILAVAWLATVVLRRRSAAVRHLVWVAAFGAVLAMPLFEFLTPVKMPVMAWSPSVRLSTESPGAAHGEINAKIAARTTPSRGQDGIPRLHGSGLEPSLSLDARPYRGHVTSRADLRLTTLSADPHRAPRNAEPPSTPAPTGLQAIMLALAAGTGLALARALLAAVSLTRIRRFASRPSELTLAERHALGRISGVRRRWGLRVASSPVIRAAMTWGVFRPVVLLPAQSDLWSADRRQVVLLHELAHVRRLDSLSRLLALVVGALYWFHPAVWLCARAMRAEAEAATDDAVLRGGIAPSAYAAELLRIAAELRGTQPRFRSLYSHPIGVSVMNESKIESRIRAILSPANPGRRAGASRLEALAVAGVAALLILPLAAATAAPQSKNLSKTTTKPKANMAKAKTARRVAHRRRTRHPAGHPIYVVVRDAGKQYRIVAPQISVDTEPIVIPDRGKELHAYIVRDGKGTGGHGLKGTTLQVGPKGQAFDVKVVDAADRPVIVGQKSGALIDASPRTYVIASAGKDHAIDPTKSAYVIESKGAERTIHLDAKPYVIDSGKPGQVIHLDAKAYKVDGAKIRIDGPSGKEITIDPTIEPHVLDLSRSDALKDADNVRVYVESADKPLAILQGDAVKAVRGFVSRHGDATLHVEGGRVAYVVGRDGKRDGPSETLRLSPAPNVRSISGITAGRIRLLFSDRAGAQEQASKAELEAVRAKIAELAARIAAGKVSKAELARIRAALEAARADAAVGSAVRLIGRLDAAVKAAADADLLSVRKAETAALQAQRAGRDRLLAIRAAEQADRAGLASEVDRQTARALLQGNQAQLAQRQAELAKAQADRELAQATYDRARKLYEQGATTKRELELARARLAQAKAQLDLARKLAEIARGKH